MTVMAVLRLRPLAGAAYAVGVPALLAGLGAWVAGSAVGAADAATHASVTIGSGIAFLLVAAAFQTTWRRLEESVSEKSRLVSTVAHELRGPLTANRAYVDLVRDGSVGTVTARQQDLLARAARATGRLEDMIAMFAQLESAENPQFPLRPETVSLASLAGDVREALAAAAEERGLTIELDGLDALPPVWVDRGSAEQVLMNLVSNAIKHSPTNGRIVLTAVSGAGGAGIAVEDEGPGVPPEERSRVFERFYRGAKARQLRLPGTGLGLYVAKSLIDRQRGTVWVEPAIGRGARFAFLLPRSTAIPPGG